MHNFALSRCTKHRPGPHSTGLSFVDNGRTITRIPRYCVQYGGRRLIAAAQTPRPSRWRFVSVIVLIFYFLMRAVGWPARDGRPFTRCNPVSSWGSQIVVKDEGICKVRTRSSTGCSVIKWIAICINCYYTAYLINVVWAVMYCNITGGIVT